MEQAASAKKVMVLYGHQEEEMAFKMMAAMEVAKEIKSLGLANPYIGLKPNLVVPQPAHWGATTSPDVVRGVLRYLTIHGLNNIAIMEGSWIGDSTEEAFRVCGYEAISQEFGIPLINLKRDATATTTINGLSFKVCRQPLQADYLINLPVLKAHCQTKITCALKNMKGCIPDTEKRRFHRLGLHQPIAYLNKALRPDLTVVDGVIGDLTHEEGGNPVRMGMILAARDPVLLDAYVAELLGYTVADIPYIGLAAAMGVGTAQLADDAVVELNEQEKQIDLARVDAGVEMDYLRQWIKEDMACSACFGGLVHALMRLKEQGKLEEIPKNIMIGQGYKKRKEVGQGIGTCTSHCSVFLSGCPPKAREIILFLEERAGITGEMLDF